MVRIGDGPSDWSIRSLLVVAAFLIDPESDADVDQIDASGEAAVKRDELQ